MRSKRIAIVSILGLGALSAIVMAQSSGATVLGKYTDTLNKATGLNVSFTTHKEGESPVSYSLSFAKPNKARIETPAKLVIADGTNVTTYNKAQNTYLVLPQGDGDIKTLLKSDEMVLFAPFFDAGALNTGSAKDLGAQTHGGQPVEAIEFPLGGKGRTATAFISNADGLIHQAKISMNSISSTGAQTAHNQIIVAKSINVTSDSDSKLYAFTAPDGAKQVTLADLNSDKWYTDLTEAESVAASTHRKVFVDFMASWCGPCHMLHDTVFVTDEFKKLSKYFVFVQIDVDQQPSIAAEYEVTAMPTQLVLDEKGSVLDKTVGYGGPEAFYSFINKSTGSN